VVLVFSPLSCLNDEMIEVSSTRGTERPACRGVKRQGTIVTRMEPEIPCIKKGDITNSDFLRA